MRDTLMYETADVARELGVSPSTIRYWMLKGWVEPTIRMPSGRRFLSADAVEAIKAIAEQQRKARVS